MFIVAKFLIANLKVKERIINNVVKKKNKEKWKE